MWKFFKFFKSIVFLFGVLLSLLILETLLNATHAESNSVIINEVMYDPVGTDTGSEWIELYNLTNGTISLQSWEIQIAGTTFKTNAVLSGEVQPQSIFLICEPSILECDLNVPKLAFQNGGSATDGIQILDQNGLVIDSLFYDYPNVNLLTDEIGNLVLDEKTSVIADAGESLGRKNYIDTDNSFTDFAKFTSPTPGQQNIVTQKDDELEPTGSSPLQAISVLTGFILLIYSARLMKYYKLTSKSNGKG